jgi:hypothetical protein
MSASFETIVMEMITGSLTTIFNLLKVLVPLMIIIQLLMVYHIIEKMAARLEGLGRILGISKNAMFPLLVGVVMGVSYGAGTILEINKANPLSRRDIILVGVFIFLCHSFVEAVILFSSIGANIFVISGGRFFIAMFITILASHIPYGPLRETERH